MAAVKLSEVKIDPVWAFKVPPAIALRRLALPICAVDGRLATAMADVTDAQVIAAIETATGLKVEPLAADRDELRAALLEVYGDVRTLQSRPSVADDPVAAVDGLLRAAVLRGASDLHFDPVRDGLRVRMRIDGGLEDFARFPAALAPALVSRLKVMASLDIAEKRAPQDGAFTWSMQQGSARRAPFDIRVATLPVRYGERVTLRLLEAGRDRLTLGALGMSGADREAFGKVLAHPHGLVLLTGPTGSGKTTTLYAAIRHLLDTAALNILTVEDPVEYDIDGVMQAEVDSGDKVNFTKALRSLLRHDPDVIMIGEIRDAESLDTALKAALTGHLVLTTLHANDAVSAVTRLLDMGMAPHKIGATLRVSAAQRLARRLCPKCREAYLLDEREALLLGRGDLAGKTAWRPRGCLACAGRGCAGRTGIFELMAPDSEISSMIAAGAREDELLPRLREKGMRTLADDAVDKVLGGVTSVAEVFRTVGAV